MKSTRVFVFTGLLTCMYVILTHPLAVMVTDTIRVSFDFLPVAFTSMLFGPIVGGIGTAAGDIIGVLLFPQGPFFPGFTLSAFLTGVIFGIFLYKKPKTILRILLAVLCITIFIDFGLNTYWLSILYGKGFFVLLPGRIVKSVIMFPVQVVVIHTMWRYTGDLIKNNFVRSRV